VASGSHICKFQDMKVIRQIGPEEIAAEMLAAGRLPRFVAAIERQDRIVILKLLKKVLRVDDHGLETVYLTDPKLLSDLKARLLGL
jgi:hypothetical protein